MRRQSLDIVLRLIPIAAVVFNLGCGNGESTLETTQLRHGQAGVRPFWNAYSGRYVYPPSFDLADSSASAKTFRVVASSAGFVVSSSVATPASSIAAVWNRLPDGIVDVRFEGLSADGVPAWDAQITTIKSPAFSTALASAFSTAWTGDGPGSPREAGLRGLLAVARLPKVTHWLRTGRPDPDYPLWVHPSKLMGVLSQGMLFLSERSDDAAVSRDAREIAIAVAAFLLTLREPDDAPLAGWTHSYWNGVDRGEHPIYMNQIMTLYPAEAAMAFLDLYDATGDSLWWDASLEIAETYRRVQRPDGTWHLLMNRESGLPQNDKLLVPVSVIVFLDRLREQYGVEQYIEIRARAFDWIMEHPVVTFAWDAQFEDTRPTSTYRNLSHREASGLARLLFRVADDPEMVRLAQELLLFVEDQFVVWTHDDAVTQQLWFPDGSKWNGDLPTGGKDWFLPAALEQYAFYTPIAGTTSNVIHAYCAAFDATGNDEYQSKARALSRSLMEAQQYHGGGEIPTHLRKRLPEENWLNNSVYAARTLIEASCL